MKKTRYFSEQVLRKRPYLKEEWCEEIRTNPVKKERQPDGRIRHWGYVAGWGQGKRAIRVVTLPDGETIHNAFPDRDFEPQQT